MNVIRGLKRFVRNMGGVDVQNQFAALRMEIQDAKILTGKCMVWQLQSRGTLARLRDAEFKVFSQFGDDGIIQYLIKQADVRNFRFVEFGVHNYTEANTRFLLVNDNWTGLVLDGDQSNMDAVKREDIYWRYDVTADQAFIDRENINHLLTRNGFTGEIGLLSVDIDGNDYWVWERITAVQPTIVIVEYNGLFGPRRAVSIPYDVGFRRADAHYSHLYWGCSLKALFLLAEKKGYAFVGCNSNGNNAYFVQKDRLRSLRPLTVEEGYECPKFRESRDRKGGLTFLSGNARLQAIADMPVVEVESGVTVAIKELT
jgi:hypothetical protein